MANIMKRMYLALLALPLLTLNGCIGLFNATYSYRVETRRLNLPGDWKQPLRIVQISDLHAGSLYSATPFKKVVNTVNALKPDIIFVTGDFVTSDPNELHKLIEPLSNMRAAYGIYGCLGNHDHYMSDEEHILLKEMIRSTGIDLLINTNLSTEIRGQKLTIASVDNYGMRQKFGDFDKALAGVDTSSLIILLNHDPNAFDDKIKGRSPNLTLCGHTHGGQIGIRIAGLELSPAKLFYDYSADLYKVGVQYIYVNRGIGMTGPPVRIGMRPEITLFIID